MKVCNGCNTEKTEDSFYPKKGRKSQSTCKTCQNARSREHYLKNKEFKKERVKKINKVRITENLRFINRIKSGPCMDCGKSYPSCVMDFDHRPGTDKKSTVSQMSRAFSRAKIEEEIAKCDLVCSNCHRLRTSSRLKNMAA